MAAAPQPLTLPLHLQALPLQPLAAAVAAVAAAAEMVAAKEAPPEAAAMVELAALRA